MIIPKEALDLYAIGVEWCSARGVPLSCLRVSLCYVWEAQMFGAASPPIRNNRHAHFDGTAWTDDLDPAVAVLRWGAVWWEMSAAEEEWHGLDRAYRHIAARYHSAASVFTTRAG